MADINFLKTGLAAVMIWLSAVSLYGAEIKGLIEDKTGAHYVVQKGDTLWKITQKLKNSPWKLPDISKPSKDIPNLNLIYPKQRINLISSKATTAPKTSVLPPQSDTPSLNKTVLSLPAVPITPPSPPVVTDSSQAEHQFIYTPIDHVGFIKKELVMPNGRIFKVKENKGMISMGDTVFINEVNHLELGKLYTTYKVSKPMIDNVTQSLIGYQYVLTGVLEIVQNEASFSIGRVIRSFQEIYVDDLLMPFENRSDKITIKPGKKEVKGKVIDSEDHSYMFGEHDLVFIDKGLEDGIEAGQEYTLFTQEQAKIANEIHNLPPVHVGRIIILVVESTTSTALVIKSQKSLRPGVQFSWFDK